MNYVICDKAQSCPRGRQERDCRHTRPHSPSHHVYHPFTTSLIKRKCVLNHCKHGGVCSPVDFVTIKDEQPA